MIAIYQYDEQGIYVGSLELDPEAALPPRSTSLKPPKTTGAKVAQWAGGAWAILAQSPVPTPEPAPDWPTLIATRRYVAETGGIVLGGLPIATDDRSKLLINGAALRASRDSGYTLHWKTLEGFIDLPAAQVLVMADAVSDHVQACFTREAELQAAVVDDSISLELIEQGWPA